MRRQKVEGDVEEGIVISRLVRDRDIEPQPSMQESIGDVPVVVAEVPRHVLAAEHDEYRPGENDGREKEQSPKRKPAAARWWRGYRHGKNQLRDAEPTMPATQNQRRDSAGQVG